MTDEQIKSMIRTQEMLLEARILIPQTNWAQTKQWRINRIEELQTQLEGNAQTSKTVRRKRKK